MSRTRDGLPRAGIGVDVHRFDAGRPLVLGGVTIEGCPGLAGHSDADVLAHAVADALLGAMADGDIGVHFPNTDARWKGACSLDLLRIVARRVRARGGRVVNVDATIVAERPRIAPHAAAMRANLAGALALDERNVSVKATTPERMGALGREEGILAMAVASVMAGRPRRAGRACARTGAAQRRARPSRGGARGGMAG